MRKILSFDQSANASGWSYWEDDKPVAWGVVYPKPLNCKGGERLTSLRSQFEDLLLNYQPDMVLIENPVGGREDRKSDDGPERNWMTMQILCQVQGVLLQLIDECGMPVQIISPSSWQDTCGIHAVYRKDRKAGAEAFVLEKYGIEGEQDVYDSICICFHYLNGGKEQKFAPYKGRPNYERSAF